MQKIRIESLEHLVKDDNGQDIANLAFKLIKDNIKELEILGIKIEMPEIVILNGIEYHKT